MDGTQAPQTQQEAFVGARGPQQPASVEAGAPEEPKAQEGPQGPSREDLQRGGDTLAAQNAEGIAIAEAQGDERGKPPIPMYFMEAEDRHRVEIDILIEARGIVKSVSRVGLGIDFSEFDHHHHLVEWMEFSLPGYEEISNYRQRSAIYRSDAGGMVIDKTQFRNFLLVWHLKDWSIRGRDGEKVELEFEDAGRLTKETIEKVYAIHALIIDVAMTAFERDALLMRT